MTNSTILLAILGYLGVMLKSIPQKIGSFIFSKYSYSITFDMQEAKLMDKAFRYLNNLNNKTLERNKTYQYIPFADRRDTVYVKCLNYGNYFIYVDKLTVMYINRTRNNKGTNNNFKQIDELTIKLFGLNANKQLKILEDILFEGGTNEPQLRIRTLSPSGLCETQCTHKKNINDIFTPNKNKLISHLMKWKSNKSFYREHGITHKTGIMLYGPPGTGKSSMIKIIASELNYDIGILPLSSDIKIDDAISMINNISIHSIVIIEDIDCIPSMNEDDTEIVSGSGVSKKNDKSLFRLVLQLLDGVNSPNDVIFICTTNNIDKIDKRLLRKGRIDLCIEMGHIDRDTAIEMCDRYNCPYTVLDGLEFPVNPSRLQHIVFEEIGIYG